MKKVLAFIAAEILFAIVAWTGGYNFDERSPAVAFFVLVALFLGAFLASEVPER